VQGESITKRSEIYQILQLSTKVHQDADGNTIRESILEKLVLERLKRLKRKKRRDDKNDRTEGEAEDAKKHKKKHKKKSSRRKDKVDETVEENKETAVEPSREERRKKVSSLSGRSSNRRTTDAQDLERAPTTRTPLSSNTTDWTGSLQKDYNKNGSQQTSMYVDDSPNSAGLPVPSVASSSQRGFTPSGAPTRQSSSRQFASSDDSWGMKKSRQSTHDDEEDLLLEDVDDGGLMMEDVDSTRRNVVSKRPSTLKPKQIGSTVGQKIRHLIIGETKMFDRSWLEQGFAFATRPDTLYGIVQNEGGSCGVIAAVQAHVLKELLSAKGSLQSLSERDYREALIDALTSILYNIDNSKMVVCVGKRSTDHANPDLCFGNFTYYECSSREQTRDCISRNIASYSNGRGLGVLQIMASAILTRGLENIQKDMDMSCNTMIVEYGYCSQELVNLLLVGRATSNVFDGMKMIGTRGDKTYLKGIQTKSEIGFLTLMESYKYLEVGSNYKEAKNNVWVIFSESHYSILFGKENNRDAKRLTLYYWDGLANQEEEIALTITRTGVDQTKDLNADSFVPPLNRCIWTLWPDATIDWSCDPLY